MRSLIANLSVFEFNHLAVFYHGNRIGGNADLLCQFGVLFEHAQLAVDGNHILGLDQVDEQFDLFLAGVTGDVHRGDGFVEHLGPRAGTDG